jgi:type II secretory pathway component PulK
MTLKLRNNGSVLLMAIFAIALLSAVVMGMLQMNTEEIQLMQNHIHRAEALAIAEAGLNDVLAQLRLDSTWNQGYLDKPFHGGSYTAVIDNSTITSTGTSAQGFVARVEADITIRSGTSPYVIRIDNLRVNK